MAFGSMVAMRFCRVQKHSTIFLTVDVKTTSMETTTTQTTLSSNPRHTRHHPSIHLSHLLPPALRVIKVYEVKAGSHHGQVASSGQGQTGKQEDIHLFIFTLTHIWTTQSSQMASCPFFWGLCRHNKDMRTLYRKISPANLLAVRWQCKPLCHRVAK